MSTATDVERTAAADPTTDLARLADLAHRFPELRPVVAANPSAYADLVEWLRAFGDPAVESALALREGRSPIAATEPQIVATMTLTPFAATAPRVHAAGEVGRLRAVSVVFFIIGAIAFLITIIKTSGIGFTVSEVPLIVLGFAVAIAAFAIGGVIEKRMR